MEALPRNLEAATPYFLGIYVKKDDAFERNQLPVAVE